MRPTWAQRAGTGKMPPMSLRFNILETLGDGHFHSGAELGRRTAVWKHLQALGDLGLDIFAVTGKGYRLAHPLELLRENDIHAALRDDSRPLLAGLELHAHLDSTNTHLSRQAANLPSGYACLAEYQSTGKGRRGRTWVSPYAGSVYLSLLWRFTVSPTVLSGLGLVSGVAVARALRQAGLHDIGLKWPNDVIWQGRKLAGTLLEMTGESYGPVNVVIGIGLNVRMSAAAGKQIDQAWVDVETALGSSVSRNTLAGLLLHHLLLALQDFQARGLAPFLREWQQWDIVTGKEVRLQLPHETLTGIAKGIDHNGALLLQSRGTINSYLAGEVSVRL
ncbi:MAG: bifunctional biotin--[acetyl-CoA-carboxylase] ligase/biotin operon repressor BirA [Gammaproteobacteria bacterium]